jgi:hypothetical protein
MYIIAFNKNKPGPLNVTKGAGQFPSNYYYNANSTWVKKNGDCENLLSINLTKK